MTLAYKFPNLRCDVKHIRKVTVLIEEVLQDCHKVEIGKCLGFQAILWMNQENQIIANVDKMVQCVITVWS